MLLVFAQCCVKFLLFCFASPKELVIIYIPISVSVRIVYARAISFTITWKWVVSCFFLVMPCFLLPIYSNYCSFGHAKRLINQRSIRLLSSTFILVPVDLRPIHDCHIHTSTVNAKHISIALFVETHTCFIVFN